MYVPSSEISQSLKDGRERKARICINTVSLQGLKRLAKSPQKMHISYIIQKGYCYHQPRALLPLCRELCIFQEVTLTL